MAITWGPSVSDATNAFRLGWELTYLPVAVTAASTYVTVTLKLYVGTRYPVSDVNNTWSLSGGFSASGSVNISHRSTSSWSSANTTLIATRTRTVALSYTTRAQVAFAVSLNRIEAIAGTARASGSITVPLRPVSAPAVPTNIRVARNNADTRHTITWTRQATTAAPYDRIEVMRWDSVGGIYKTIGTAAGTAVSFVDTSTVANRRYRYQLRATNKAGASPTGEIARTPYIYTTPAPPQTVTARKTGSDIQVAWSRYAYEGAHYEVQNIAGGTAVTPTATTPAHAWGWLHTNPDPTRTHAYRVRARIVDPVAGTLVSAWAPTSPTVQLLTAPAAPTGLKPGSGAVDATEPTTLSLTHNPLDTTELAYLEVRHRLQGSSAWTTTGKRARTTGTHTVAADTWPNGAFVEWQGRTWGEHANPSPWSAITVFGTSARPTATILEPTGLYRGSRLTVAWAFYDSEESVQTYARVSLYDAAGARLEQLSSPGAASTATFAQKVADGQTYQIGVQVRDEAGLWSFETRETIPVGYASPPTGQLTARWDQDTGTIAVNITHPDPEPLVDYAWTGAPHASASIRRQDGAETARNLCPNPAPRTTTGWAAITSALATLSTGHPALETTALATTEPYIFTPTATGPLTPGGTYTLSADIELPDGLPANDGGPDRELQLLAHLRTGNIYLESGAYAVPAFTGVRRLSVTTTLPDPLPNPTLDLAVLSSGLVLAGTRVRIGQVVITASDTDPGYFDGDSTNTGGQAPGVECELWRSANGADWALVADRLPLDTTVVDPIPAAYGVNHYRAVTVSELPSTSETSPYPVLAEGQGWIYLNGGPGFAQLARIRDNATVTYTPTRARAAHQFAGRDFQTEVTGQARTYTIALQARLGPDSSTAEDWEAVTDLPAPLCYRDPNHRIFVGSPQLSHTQVKATRELSLTAERRHHRE